MFTKNIKKSSSIFLLLTFLFLSTFITTNYYYFVNAQATSPAPKEKPEMTWKAWVCVASVIVVLLLLFTEVASCCATMFSVTLFLVLTGILSTQEFLSGLSNSGVCTVALLYIVVGPLTQLPKVRQVIQLAISASKPKKKKKVNENGEEDDEEEETPSCCDAFFQSQAWARFKICSLCMSTSWFVNNTPLVAMITPIVKNFCRERGTSPAQILMSVNAATLFGGTFAVIGTSTNLVYDGFMRGTDMGPMPFFEMIKISGVPSLIALLYLIFAPPYVLPTESGGLFRMLRANASSFLGQFLILPHSPLVSSVGVTVADFESFLPPHLQNDLKLAQIVRHIPAGGGGGDATSSLNNSITGTPGIPPPSPDRQFPTTSVNTSSTAVPMTQRNPSTSSLHNNEETTIVITLAPPPPTERFLPGDVLVFAGELNQLNTAARALGLQWLPPTNLTSVVPHVATTSELESMIVGEMKKKTNSFFLKQQKEREQQQKDQQQQNHFEGFTTTINANVVVAEENENNTNEDSSSIVRHSQQPNNNTPLFPTPAAQLLPVQNQIIRALTMDELEQSGNIINNNENTSNTNENGKQNVATSSSNTNEQNNNQVITHQSSSSVSFASNTVQHNHQHQHHKRSESYSHNHHNHIPTSSPATLAVNANVVSFQNTSFAMMRNPISVNDNNEGLLLYQNHVRANSLTFPTEPFNLPQSNNNTKASNDQNQNNGNETNSLASPNSIQPLTSLDGKNTTPNPSIQQQPVIPHHHQLLPSSSTSASVDFVEVVISHQSPVLGLSVGSGAFQRLYGVCVLALRPHGVTPNANTFGSAQQNKEDVKKTTTTSKVDITTVEKKNGNDDDGEEEEMQEKQKQKQQKEEDKTSSSSSSSDSEDEESEESNKNPDLTGHRLSEHLYGVGDTILVVGPTSFIDKFSTHFFVASKCEDTSQRKQEQQQKSRLRVAVPNWFPCGIYPEDELEAENLILPSDVSVVLNKKDDDQNNNNEPTASTTATTPKKKDKKKHHHHTHHHHHQKYIIIPEWYGYLTLPIFIAMMSCAIAGFDIVICACVAVCALVIFKIITLKEAIASIDLETVIMVAFSLGLGISMKNSGLADVVGDLVTSSNIKGFPLLLLIAVVTSVFTNVISSKATASMMFPIIYSIYTQIGVDPLGPVAMAAVLSSVALCTPYAFATNVIIMGPGGYSPADFVKFGVPLNLMMLILCPVMTAAVYNQW